MPPLTPSALYRYLDLCGPGSPSSSSITPLAGVDRPQFVRALHCGGFSRLPVEAFRGLTKGGWSCASSDSRYAFCLVSQLTSGTVSSKDVCSAQLSPTGGTARGQAADGNPDKRSGWWKSPSCAALHLDLVEPPGRERVLQQPARNPGTRSSASPVRPGPCRSPGRRRTAGRQPPGP